MVGLHSHGRNAEGGGVVAESHEYFIGTNRPQTAKKLSILRKYFAVWLTIWAGDQCASWVDRDWYVLDLFGGTGLAQGATGETLSGSPLVFLEEIQEHADRLSARGVTIHLLCVEQDSGRFAQLEARVAEFLSGHVDVASFVEVQCINKDANEVVRTLSFSPTDKAPCFLFVDPFGTEIDRESIDALVAMPWKLDVLFNYMVESIRRVHGVAQGDSSRAAANARRVQAFFGTGAELHGSDDVENPRTYAKAAFSRAGMKTVAFRMKKPGTVGTQYILLFASRNDTVIRVMRDVYAKEMTDHFGQASLFSAEEYLEGIDVIQ